MEHYVTEFTRDSCGSVCEKGYSVVLVSGCGDQNDRHELRCYDDCLEYIVEEEINVKNRHFPVKYF